MGATIHRVIGAVVACFTLAAVGQTNDAPYGSATFRPCADIDGVKQLQVVWDFNFVDPKLSASCSTT